MNFIQFLTEEKVNLDEIPKGKKEISLFFGRFQPFHVAHLKGITDTLKKYPKYPVMIGIIKGPESSKDKMKNPLSFDYQKKLIKKSIKGMDNILVYPEPFEFGFFPYIFKVLRENGYEVKLLVGGKDREPQYAKWIDELNKFDSVDIKFFAPDTRHLVSATQVRETIRNNDFKKFKEYTRNLEDEFETLKGFV